jgi:WD40 repeat protein
MTQGSASSTILGHIRGSGSALIYVDGGFVLDAVGPLTPDQVRSRDAAGDLLWVAPETREWFLVNFPAGSGSVQATTVASSSPAGAELVSVDHADASFTLLEGSVLPVNGDLPGRKLLQITPDGSLLTYLVYNSVDAEAHVQIFDRKAKKLVREERVVLPPQAECVAFRPDMGIVLVSSGNLEGGSPLQAFRIDGGEKILDLSLSRPAFGLAISPNGRLAASIGYGGKVFAWDLSTGQGILAGQHPDSGKTIGFTPDNRRLVSLSDDWTLKVWDIASHAVCTTGQGEPDRYETHLSQDCRFAVVAKSDTGAMAVDVSTGKTIATWEPEGKRGVYGISALYAASNGSLVAWVSTSEELKAWHVQGERSVQALPGSASSVAPAIPLDGSCVAVVRDDNTLAIWEAADGGHLQP